MMVLRRLFPLLLLLLLLIRMPSALATPAQIDMHHMSWAARDGAPQMVLTMAQTRDGWLWLGNNNGLFRFDGVRFERYAEPGHKLPGSAVATLTSFDDGALWIGYRYGGVSVLERGVLRHYNERDGLPASGGVWGLERDGTGRTWAATAQGMFYLDHARWHAASETFALPVTVYKTLLRDRHGDLWTQGNEGVYRLTAGARQFVKATPEAGIGVVLEAPDASVWSWNAPGAKLRQLAAPAAGAVSRRWAIDGNVTSMMFDSHGDAWVGRTDGVEYHTQHGLQRNGYQQGLSGPWVTAMFEDHEGNIWIATSTGIDRFRHKRIATVPTPVQFNIRPLMADSDNSVWIGRLNYTPKPDGTFSMAPVWRDRPGNWGTDPVSIHRDSAGVLWLAPYGELWRKQGSALRRVPLPQEGGMILSMASGDDGALWAAFLTLGAYRLGADGGWQHMGPATGLADEAPSVLSSAPGRGLWLGYPRSRLLHLQNGQWRRYGPAEGLALGMTQAIHLKGANVWIGGENGVALLREGRIIPVAGAGGLNFEGVSGIVELDDGDLWLHAANGLFHVRAAEIARLLRTRGYQVGYERLDSVDGLDGIAPARLPVPSMIQAADGHLWLSTTAGGFRFDPLSRPAPAPPVAVQIRAIGQPGQLASAQQGQRLPQGTTALQIDYTALALAMPERVDFRYRLDGVDTQWQQAGTRRTAYYNNLGPGDYRFSVQATSYDGVWGEQASTLSFSIAPTITQSRWFNAACALLLLAACWALYRWRLHTFAAQVTARLQERTRERERIARELHDTILQSVQGMILHVHAASLELPSREPARLMIEQALRQADDALSEGRDRVRDLRAGEPDEQDLAQAIEHAGQRLRMQDAAPLQVRLEGGPRKLHSLVYEEVLAIATEAVANAYLHASAERIDVLLHYSAREFALCIRDNGTGVPAEVIQAGGRSNHWGMRGIIERAERINARIRLRSDAGAGTEWRLTLAGALAYRTS